MDRINRDLLEFIYNEMGATYMQNANGVQNNVNNKESENLEYLGTYFPRSYNEAYGIYNNIFQNESVKKYFDNKNIIKILDIGCGTGGSTLGLLHAFCENFNEKNIWIYSIDGNENALEIQERLLDKLPDTIELNGNKFFRKRGIREIDNKEEFRSILENIRNLDEGNLKFDIIQSFKMINEFYREEYFVNNGMYESFLDLGKEILNESGMICLVDVTDRINCGNLEFMSILINKEILKYLKEDKEFDLKYIIPRCCSVNHKECMHKNNCFSHHIIKTMINGREVCGKINYKLFVNGILGETLKREVGNTKIECVNQNCFCNHSEFRSDYNCAKNNEEQYIL